MSDEDIEDPQQEILRRVFASLSDEERDRLVGGELLERPEGQLMAFIGPESLQVQGRGPAFYPMLLTATPEKLSRCTAQSDLAREAFWNLSEALVDISGKHPEVDEAMEKLAGHLGELSGVTASVINALSDDRFHLLWLLGKIPEEVLRAHKSALALRMHADSPAQKAKAHAQELWPTANRKGWTATLFHTALKDEGHAIPYDTARKWLTSLRKTGTC